MMLFLAQFYQSRIETENSFAAEIVVGVIASLLDDRLIDNYLITLEKDEFYYFLLNQLRVFQNETEIAFIVVARIFEDRQIFIFDTDSNEESYIDLGEVVYYGDAEAGILHILEQIAQGQPVEPYIHRSRWGWLRSAVAPIFRDDGSIAAHVTVSVSMDRIVQERNFSFIFLGIIIVFISAGSITANLFAIQRFVISPERRKAEEHALLLESLNRTKSEFFGNISHQMKTPLTIIATDIQLAEQFVNEGKQDSAKELLLEAWQETMQMANLVSEAIALSRGQEVVKSMESFDFGAVIKATLAVFELLIVNKGNTLKQDIADLPHIRGNADMLAGALVNLLSNANHHTKNGLINVEWAEGPQWQYSLTIRDTGEGISPEILPRVFERGISEGSGTGLGLAIVKSVMEYHDGQVLIESEQGKGTVVTLLFRSPKAPT